MHVSKKNPRNPFRSLIKSITSTTEGLHNILWQKYQLHCERWGSGVETQKNVRGEIGGWGRVPFNETYAPLLSTIYDGA